MNKTEELASITGRLAYFSNQGIPLYEIINHIKGDIKNNFLKNAFDKLSVLLRGGKSLSKALDSSPSIYPGYIKKIIEKGEEKGNLSEKLQEITSFMTEEEKLESSICKKGVIIPLIIYTNSVAALFLFMIFIILPTCVELFEGMDLCLPLPTRILIGITKVCRNPCYLIGPAGLLFIIILNLWALFSNPIRSSITYYIPIIGDIVRKYYTYKIASRGSLLLKAGLSVEEVFLELSRGIDMGHAKRALAYISKRLKEGEKLATIFEVPQFFPPTFSLIMVRGEKEGKLEKFMRGAGDMYKEELIRLQPKDLMQPGHVFTVIFGFIMGFIIISVFLPMYQLIGCIK
ncbi:MAG TPA: type II secretion system F family protein [Candidatus Eremiobacteraeota bacterium]|nr:MAG: putative type II secretion system protein F [bacterium ADurb.Bin363]HPZ08520.1 type II secretion system F family protein [Candidatus Eremiobacteraeota bacterium]